MIKLLRILAMLPLVLLLCLAPEAAATNAPQQIFLPTISRPVTYTFQRIGPPVGRTLGVAQDPFNPAVVYAMTFGSGMYKSSDYGANWAPISAGISYLTLQSMAIDPVQPNIIYAGTYGDASYPYNGVFKSTNGGATWAKTGDMVNIWNGAAYRNPVVYALEVDPNNPNRLFAGTRMKGLPGDALGGGGVFRSENGGATWVPVNNGLPNADLYVYDLAIDPDRPGLVYAAMHQNGLYRSYDYGNRWSRVSIEWSETELEPWSGRAIAVDPFDPDILYFGAMKKQGAFRSSDGGRSWSRMGSTGWDITVGGISPDPYNWGRVYAGVITGAPADYLMRTTNPAGSWSVVAALPTWGPIAFAPDGASAYVGVDGNGVYKTTNGGQSWFRSTNGLTGYSVTGLAVSPTNPNLLFAALFGQGVYYSQDGGASWAPRNSGLGNSDVLGIAIDPRNPAVLYVATSDSGVYYTQNSGAAWASLTGGFPTALAETTAQIENPFENHPLPERDDLTDHPDRPLPRPASLAVGLAQAKTLAVSPFDSGVLAGTAGRGIYRLAWPNWVATSQRTGTVYSLLHDRSTSGRVLAAADAASGSILLSTNKGETWALSNTGIAGRAVYNLAQHPTLPGLFLAGTDSGVYFSEDGGKTWKLSGLAGTAVKAVGVLSNGGYFAGTDTDSFYASSPYHTWGSLTPLLSNVGVQGIVPGPGGSTEYFFTRLSGIVCLTAK